MKEETKPMQKSRLDIKAIVIGFLAGIVVFAVVMVNKMPSMMIVTKQSTMSFDDTVAELEKRIPAQGWTISGGKAVDMNASMAKQGIEFGPRVRLIKLCKAEYAKDVLTTDRYVSCMMPCTIAVWEGDDGNAYISKMNMSLMAKMFGGNIKRVLGGKVAGEEEEILSGILK